MNTALSAACQRAGISLEACEDIFQAIEKGTKQSFSCAIVDWNEQPEAGFLLKRVRESAQNTTVVAVAVVEREPSAAEMRDHRLNFLLYRPIETKEAADVLDKAREKMPEVKLPAAARPISPAPADIPSVASAPSSPVLPFSPAQDPPLQSESEIADHAASPEPSAETEIEETPEDALPLWQRIPWKPAVAATLTIVAAICVWNARDTISYLERSRGSRSRIFKDSIAALFSLDSVNTPVSPATDVDSYVNRTSSPSDPHLHLGVVASESDVSTSAVPLRQAFDFPLPTPSYEPPPALANATRRGTVPDSLRGSAPIPPPVVVTTQAPLPVSAPVVIPISTPQFNEPVNVSEEAARALLVHSVAPAYPAEAAAQKLHGPVILQATISRDGAVEDLKIVRGSFLLSKAAITAVKQWRFQPYTINGHPTEIQTLLTINFPTS